MFCKNCGSELPDQVKFCPSCGTPCTLGQDILKQAEDAFQKTSSEVDSAVQEVEETFRSSGSSSSYQTGGSMPTSGPLRTDRGLISYILLSLVTCGIYSWFFLYCLAKDVNIACDGDGDSTPGLLPFILLSMVTCGFYAYWWDYKLGNRLQSNAPRYGLYFQENGTTVLLWALIGMVACGLGPFFAMYILIKNTNAICQAYNQKHGLA